MSVQAPGPRGLPITGSLLKFKFGALPLLQQAAKDYGDVVRLRFGPIRAHLLNHPDHIEHVLSRHADHYDKNTRSVARIKATCGDSLLSANETAWARHRALIQPLFRPSLFTNISEVVASEIKPLADRWEQAAQMNTAIDVAADMMHLVIGISARLMFSSSIDATKIEDALAVILEDTWRRLEAPVDLSLLSGKLHRPSFKKAIATVNTTVNDLIQERQRSTAQPDDMLSRLLAAHKATDDTKLSDQELRDAAVTLLLAGHETTANALAWAFYEMAQLPDRDPLTTNPAHVFAEAVRMYPSIWIVERRVVVDDVIAGYRIPRGTSVLISPYLIHRHPNFWESPNTFDPDRHATRNDRPRHAYIPFGLGQNRCIGLHMAQAIAGEVLRQLYGRFHLAPAQKVNGIDPKITLRPDGPLLLRPKVR